MTDHDTLRDQISEAIIPAMIEHGPDGHVDGYREITDAVIDALNLTAGPDPIGKDPGLYVTGWID